MPKKEKDRVFTSLSKSTWQGQSSYTDSEYWEMAKLFVREWIYDYTSHKASKKGFLENQTKKKM